MKNLQKSETNEKMDVFSKVYGEEWYLIMDSSYMKPKKREWPYLNFEITPQKKIYGFGGCNDFSADFSIKGDSITITNFFKNDVSCNLDAVEMEFLANLQRATKYRIKADTLFLVSKFKELKFLKE
jgi:heat shock protein HslJ